MQITIRKMDQGLDPQTCLIASELFMKLNLKKNQIYTFRLGHRTCKAFVKEIEGGESYFSEGLMKSLLIPGEIVLNLWLRDKEICLGPVIGIFVNPRFCRNLIKKEAPSSAEMNAQASHLKVCFTYYFSVKNIDWINGRVKGYRLVSDLKVWQEGWLSLPDVLYDKGVRFSESDKLLAKVIRKRLKEDKRTNLINSQHYLGKWQVFKRLSKYAEINKYIPETLRYNSFQDAESLLDKYGYIFLKSYYGSHGTEVIAVEKKGKKYQLSFLEGLDLKQELSKKQDLKQIKVPDKQRLKECIEKFFGRKKFIVQVGLRLLTYESKPMDMRILIQKDSYGKWQAVYNQVSISPGSFPITNNEEADMANYEDIYTFLKPQRDINLPTDAELRETTIKIATFLEKEFGSFGEIGMDMAVDEAGEVWFLEANAKPEKDPTPILEKTEGVSPQFLMIFDYAKFLAGVR